MVKRFTYLARCNFELTFIILAEMLLLLRKQAIKNCFTVQPHLTTASALPGKTQKHENCIC